MQMKMYFLIVEGRKRMSVHMNILIGIRCPVNPSIYSRRLRDAAS